jgi:LacI family transcriptional regulator
MNDTARQNRISPSTIVKVRKVADRLGYRPNAYGRALRTKKSGILTFISENLTDPNTTEIIRALGAVVRGNGYGLMLMDLGGADDVAESDLRCIETSFSEGFFLHVPSSPLMDRCSGGILLDKPSCVLGRHLHAEGVPYVEVDNALGAELAVRHLVERGAKRLGIIADVESAMYTIERMAGCERVLAGFRRRDVLVYHRDPAEGQYEAGAAAVHAWSGATFPDAVFAMGDVLAIGALHAMRERGIRCPGDARIVGFDGISLARYACPPLTTVAQPFREMAEAAIEILAAALAGEAVANRQRLVAPRLIVRESSG